MNKITLVTFLGFCAMIFCTSCEKDDTVFVGIEGISFENYPRVDGSTSTDPLNHIIAAKLFGLKYEWVYGIVGFKNVEQLPVSFTSKIQCYQTNGAIMNLIDNKTDLIIVARKMSEDEKQYANDAGVSLIETPIALDALDFIVNSQNRVNSLSVEQIQNIYLGNIKNWNEVGGANEEITPFIRNENSGSQEMMNELVMNNAGMPDWTVSYADELTLFSMLRVYDELIENKNGICFTPHYYKEFMVLDDRKESIKTLNINGIAPDKKSIKNKTYPFVANVYVSIRSDTDTNSMTYKLYEWLQSESGKNVIKESGYVPN
jgi:ABC-type phosphate transport system, periplasmic component